MRILVACSLALCLWHCAASSGSLRVLQQNRPEFPVDPSTIKSLLEDIKSPLNIFKPPTDQPPKEVPKDPRAHKLPPCPILLAPTNGQITFSKTPVTIGATAVISCNSGCKFTGKDPNVVEIAAECAPNKAGRLAWQFADGAAPTCEEATCPPLTNITGGSVVISKTPATNGAVASFTCNSGCGFDGQNTTVTNLLASCIPDGAGGLKWDYGATPPSCSPVPCPDLTINGGTVSYSATPPTIGAVASITCNAGCGFAGASTQQGTQSAQCVADPVNGGVKWLVPGGATPSCEFVICAEPSTDDGVFLPASGTVTTAGGDVGYAAGTTAILQCAEGYWLPSPYTVLVVTCDRKQDGTGANWSSQIDNWTCNGGT